MYQASVVSVKWIHKRLVRRLGESVAALAIGVLLGVLAVMPYEQWIPVQAGMTEPVLTILRSLVVAFGLTGLHLARASELTFDASTLLQAPHTERTTDE